MALYGGIHQAALSRITDPLPTIENIPSAHWNCTAFDLPQFSLERTRIVHLTGLLRQLVFGEQVPEELTQLAAPIVAEWNKCAAVAA
jgi:hypothetical protein